MTLLFISGILAARGAAPLFAVCLGVPPSSWGSVLVSALALVGGALLVHGEAGRKPAMLALGLLAIRQLLVFLGDRTALGAGVGAFLLFGAIALLRSEGLREALQLPVISRAQHIRLKSFFALFPLLYGSFMVILTFNLVAYLLRILRS